MLCTSRDWEWRRLTRSAGMPYVRCMKVGGAPAVHHCSTISGRLHREEKIFTHEGNTSLRAEPKGVRTRLKVVLKFRRYRHVGRDGFIVLGSSLRPASSQSFIVCSLAVKLMSSASGLRWLLECLSLREKQSIQTRIFSVLRWWKVSFLPTWQRRIATSILFCGAKGHESYGACTSGPFLSDLRSALLAQWLHPLDQARAAMTVPAVVLLPLEGPGPQDSSVWQSMVHNADLKDLCDAKCRWWENFVPK